jgi:hypothetical protein
MEDYFQGSPRSSRIENVNGLSFALGYNGLIRRAFAAYLESQASYFVNDLRGSRNGRPFAQPGIVGSAFARSMTPGGRAQTRKCDVIMCRGRFDDSTPTGRPGGVKDELSSAHRQRNAPTIGRPG